jgi:outer membrane protein, heavy metal efflux system
METMRRKTLSRLGAGAIRRTTAVVCVVVATSVAGVARAQHAYENTPTTQPSSSPRDSPSPNAPSVESLVALALEQSPTVSALRARVASAREKVSPAGALPDPMVGVMYQSMGPPWSPMAPMSMAQIEVSQAIPYPGKRGSRRASAEADADVGTLGIQDLRARLTAEVRKTYARLYALDRERDSVESARRIVDILIATVSSRYSAGQAEQEALAKIVLERSELDERLTDITAERVALVATMNRLTSQPETTTFGRIEALPEVGLTPDRVAKTAIDRSPDLGVQRAAVRAASRRLDAAHIDNRPDFLVGLAGGATTTGDPLITLRVGVTLPLWGGDKQKPMIRSAEHDIDAAQQNLKAAELAVREQVTRLMAQWQRDEQQIDRYRSAIVPQSSVVLDAARGSYANGRGDFSMVVEDFRRWLDARVGLARREADRFMTWAEIQSLIATPQGGAK